MRAKLQSRGMKAYLPLISLFMALILFSCGGNSANSSQAAPQTPSNTDVLIVGRAGDAVSLDPSVAADGESLMVSSQIFEGLVRFKAGTTQIEPALAESWDISSDNLTYTFKLRKGVVFHDGTPFNADAVLLSFNRQGDENNPYHGYGSFEYWGYMSMSDIVDTVEKVDDFTVAFHLKKVAAPFIANLAMPFASIVSPTALEKYKGTFNVNPVGTGPFEFSEWQRDDSITLKKNTSYWDAGKPSLSRLVFKVIVDPTSRWLALQKKEVDMILLPAIEDLDAIKADKDVVMLQQPGLNVGYLALNNNVEKFKDKRVRQAINYAVNHQEIVDGAYAGQAKPAVNPIPPTIWSYNTDIQPYPYNPERAKALLAEAGYPDGFDLDLWAMPVSRPYMIDGTKVAEILQAQLAEVGIKVNIQTREWGAYLEGVSKGEHEAALLGWNGDNGDPDNFLYVLLSADAAEVPAGNIAFWKNAEFTNLVKQAQEEVDVTKRTELYKQAQVVFHEEAPWVPLVYSEVSVPFRKGIEGYKISPLGLHSFTNVHWATK